MNLMSSKEKKALINVSENHDILTVTPSLIKPRRFKNKPRAEWDVVEITSRDTFVVSTQHAAFENCHRILIG